MRHKKDYNNWKWGAPDVSYQFNYLTHVIQFDI